MLIPNFLSLAYISLSGFGGGLLYISIKDFYEMYILGTRFVNTSINRIGDLINIGFLFGVTIGVVYLIRGKPLLSF